MALKTPLSSLPFLIRVRLVLDEELVTFLFKSTSENAQTDDVLGMISTTLRCGEGEILQCADEQSRRQWSWTLFRRCRSDTLCTCINRNLFEVREVGLSKVFLCGGSEHDSPPLEDSYSLPAPLDRFVELRSPFVLSLRIPGCIQFDVLYFLEPSAIGNPSVSDDMDPLENSQD